MEYNNKQGLSNSFKEKALIGVKQRFPNLTERAIDSVNVRYGNAVPIAVRSQAIYAEQCDSGITKSYMKSTEPFRPLVRYEADPLVAEKTSRSLDSLISKGYTADEAKQALAKQIVPVVTFDSAAGQYVVHPYMKGVNDSIIQNSSIPYWNIGILYKIFKQPYAPSFAKRLVSVESFGNAWCDMVMVFKEAFEGFGKISTTALGNVEMTASDPVVNQFGVIMSKILTISIDYESSIMEDIAKQQGSPLVAQGIADRELAARTFLDYLCDQLIYFGDPETGFQGLMQSCTPESYSGDSFNKILEGASTSKGSDIAQAFINVISDLCQKNHYMASEMRINVSTFTYRALTSTVYSNEFNPESPLEIIRKHFASGENLGGGLQRLNIDFAVDPMLDPTQVTPTGTVNPFNPNKYDLTFFTFPSINSKMGEQQGLVILPEPLSNFIVPPVWSRQGMLYTMYRRIGGIIAPIEGTVHCIQGLGYSED